LDVPVVSEPFDGSHGGNSLQFTLVVEIELEAREVVDEHGPTEPLRAVDFCDERGARGCATTWREVEIELFDAMDRLAPGTASVLGGDWLIGVLLGTRQEWRS
jgi:hypothetical protein